MSSRNKSGIHLAQSRFLRAVMGGQKTVAQIVRDLNIKPETLRRWMTEQAFVNHWEAANQFLRMARVTDGETALIAGIDRERGRAGGAKDQPPAAANSAAPATPAVPSPTIAAFVAATAPPPPPARPAPPAMSERERIRAVNGERAAQAFDELVRRRREREAAEAAQAAVADADAKRSPESAAAPPPGQPEAQP